MDNKKIDIDVGTIYDINKSLINQEPVLSKHILDAKLKKVQKYFEDLLKENYSFGFKDTAYFMLLCHEQRDYTVFTLKNSLLDFKNETEWLKQAKTAIDELKICLQNRGKIISIEPTWDKVAFEIWIRNDEDNFCYYLFPYNDAVIHCY